MSVGRVEFKVKDSGKRVDFPSGMHRDTDEGKPRYDLVDKDMLLRWAHLMAEGAKKYGEDNWRHANSLAEQRRFEASAFRHFMAWLRGEMDEDHAAAVMFNIAAAEYVKTRFVVEEPVTTAYELTPVPWSDVTRADFDC